MENAGPTLANLIVQISANAARLQRGIKATQPTRRSPKKRKPKRQTQ